MVEGETIGVKHLPGDRREIGELSAAAGVEGIAKDRMAKVGEMHADLMGAACVGTAEEEGSLGGLVQETIVGEGWAAGAGEDGHFFALRGVTADRAFAAALGVTESAVDDGEVVFFDSAGSELGSEEGMGVVVPSDEEKAGGVGIETMDDAGTIGAGPGGEGLRAVAGEEELGEGAAKMARGRVDDEAGRFVEDDEVVVLVEEGGVREAVVRFPLFHGG